MKLRGQLQTERSVTVEKEGKMEQTTKNKEVESQVEFKNVGNSRVLVLSEVSNLPCSMRDGGEWKK